VQIETLLIVTVGKFLQISLRMWCAASILLSTVF